MKQKGRPPHQDILTPAEWRVVNLAQHGMTNNQIANSLNVSINAVKYHITNVIGKLQVIPDTRVTDKKSLLNFLGTPIDSPFHRSTHMNTEVPIQAIGQVSRSVKDVAKAEQWYRDVLGLTHLYTFDKLAFFDVDGVRLFLYEVDSVTAESIIYFKTSNIKNSHQNLRQNGVEFTHAPIRFIPMKMVLRNGWLFLMTQMVVH